MIIKVSPNKLQAQKDANRVIELKQFLRDTDYVTFSDYDKDKRDAIAQRQSWREEIRRLEPK